MSTTRGSDEAVGGTTATREGLPPVPPPPGATTAGHDTSSPLGAPDAEQPRSPRQQVGWLEARWARMPLRANLVLLTTTLLVVGLGVAAVATTMLTSRYLVSQVDSQLREAATQLSQSSDGLSSLINDNGTSVYPSEYYLGIVMDDGTQRTWGFSTSYGDPSFEGAPAATDTQRLTAPFAARSQSTDGTTLSGRTSWRAIGLRVLNRVTGESGTAYLALPLAGVTRTVHRISTLLFLSALLITITGAVVAYGGVGRSLRPLRRIEATAAKIAQGDLSARVPQGPRSTEVGSLSHSLNAMLTQIETAFDAREASEARMRRFVSDASHELRTPLAAIRGYGELYRMGALSTREDMDDTMRRIEDSAHRMGSLVEDLLDLARLDEGRALQQVPVDLTALAVDGAADLHALDPSRTVALVALHAPAADGAANAADGAPVAAPGPGDTPAAVIVRGDEDRLRQVVVNLVGNVARHTPQGTPVEIALGTDPEAQLGVIEVRDHGPGVPPDQVSRVFERFYRADSSRDRRSGGSGLGLAIVAAISAALGGDATIHETPGGGLTVRITVPMLTPPAERSSQPGAAPADA